MIDNLPKVSVITVCYNAASLLPKTISSVIEQTYAAVEYIVVDGASEDRSAEVVLSYGEKVHEFICGPDLGLYDAMNKGIRRATGDLVIFLNAGDYFVSKDVLEFTVFKMNRSEADLFFGRIVWNDPRTKDIVLSDHSWSTFSWDLKKSNFPHPATFYKRSLFERVGYFDLTYPITADYEWNVRALVLCKVKFQYINIIVTVFFADGISNNASLLEKKQIEIDQIDESYFKPLYIHKKLEERNSLFCDKWVKKIISKIFSCRLSRVYY